MSSKWIREKEITDAKAPDADFSHQIRSGHYNRALEEAIQTHKSQWAKDWESKNPLSGGATFSSMSPTERVSDLLPIQYHSLKCCV